MMHRIQRRGILIPRTGQSRPEIRHSYGPTPKECAEVKNILAAATLFPPEVVDIIMDFAEYWVCSVAIIDPSAMPHGAVEIHGSHNNENQFILRTEPLGLTGWHCDPKLSVWQDEADPGKLEEEYSKEELGRYIDGPPLDLEHPFRKVVFDITSRDQGWSHNRSFSWTWFEAGIDRFDKGHTCTEQCVGNAAAKDSPIKVPTMCALRPVWPVVKDRGYDHELEPSTDHKIQCNGVANTEWQDHHVEWSWTDRIDPESQEGEELKSSGRGPATGDGSFVRNLRVGDMVTIWGYARFPGWVNNVQKAQIRVYWAL